MTILVKRTGGYAGLTEQVASVDTARLGGATAQKVQEILRSSGFFGLPAEFATSEVGADFFRYEVTVREGNREHSVAFRDDGSDETASLRGLVQALTQLA